MRKIFLSIALVVLAVGVAGAGDKGEYGKCEMTTQECLNAMTKYWKEHGWVGVELEGIEDAPGMVVTRVVPDSPAETAGLEKGDILFAMNDIELNEENEEKLSGERKGWTVGAEVKWTMLREGQEKDFEITLASMPAEVLAAWIGQHMLDHAEVEVAAVDE